MVLETTWNANRFLRLGPPSTGGPRCALHQHLLMMLFQIGGRLYLPPSLLSEGFKAQRSRDDVTLKKAVEIAESFVSCQSIWFKQYLFRDN